MPGAVQDATDRHGADADLIKAVRARPLSSLNAAARGAKQVGLGPSSLDGDHGVVEAILGECHALA